MIPADETFDGSWPFRPRFYEGNGFRMHYVEEGEGDPIVCLHGEADRAIPTEVAVGMFRSTWPKGPVVTLPGVGHFIQEDAPEAACALIEQFIQMTGSP